VLVAKQKSMGETFQELRELLVAYARQETVDPLNKLKQYLGWGIPGAFLLGLGTYLISLGILRGLQQFDNTASSWASMLPYLGSLAWLFLIVLLCARKISRSINHGDDGTKVREP
jgi:hypothetical protein